MGANEAKLGGPDKQLLLNNTRGTYLQLTTTHTLLTAEFISRSCQTSLAHEDLLLEHISTFADKLDERTPAIDGETQSQRTQRLGWIIQAAGIAYLTQFDMTSALARIAWRDTLTREILQTRQEQPTHSLPGITIKFREPFDGYIDQFSTNLVAISFDNQPDVYESSRGELSVASGLRSISHHTENYIQALQLIEGYEPLDYNSAQLAASFMHELDFLLVAMKDDTNAIPFHHVKKRLDLLRQLILSDVSLQENLRVRYKEASKFHGFEMTILGGAHGSLWLQADEVSDTYWQFLTDISRDDTLIPPRTSLNHTQLLRRRESQYISDEDDWGEPVARPNHTPYRWSRG